MGYKDLSTQHLMTNIGGQPYIDTRLSFNSFLPLELNKKISEKIILNKLKNIDSGNLKLVKNCCKGDIKSLEVSK